MILQELTNFYQKLLNNPDIEISEPGFSRENISFKIVINKEGKFKTLEDLRVMNGSNAVPVKIEVPKFDGKRTSGIKPYFLWDKSDYTVGYTLKENKNSKEPEVKPTPKHQAAFIELMHNIVNTVNLKSDELIAVKQFCSSPQEIEKLKQVPLWKEFLGTFALFEVDGYGSTVFDSESIKVGWKKYYNNKTDDGSSKGYCSVLGELQELARSHPTIKKGVGGKNDTPLVSCNVDSGESYGKKKGENAQISAKAASYFTGALNYLIDTRKHNINIADTKTLFWAENNPLAVDIFSGLFDNQGAEDDGHNRNLEIYLKRIREGKIPDELDDDSRFFVLGLAPNSARISVRFWHTDTVRDMGLEVIKHFNDLRMIPQKYDKDNPAPSMWQLLNETAAQHKSENIPANIAGPLMRSILTGTKYPVNILAVLVGRMRTDQDYRKLNFYRASFIKAILNRNYNKELTVALDKRRTSAPYCLGRLFSVLEKTQEEASGGTLNATIKDRYFASASATPKVVFPILLKLTQNHLKKLKSIRPGAAVNKEKQLSEIMGMLSDFPATMKLEEQGEFAIGYYHQRQEFFTKKSEETEGVN
jgi:CRISPR-associated protein Csd1